VVPGTVRVKPLDLRGDLTLESSTISFTSIVREIFGGGRRSTWTTYTLIISTFVQVIFWFHGEPGSLIRL
jgi:hypothetical protein